MRISTEEGFFLSNHFFFDFNVQCVRERGEWEEEKYIDIFASRLFVVVA